MIISDTFGRAWRKGVVDVAIGCDGVAAVVDLKGTLDANGRELVATEMCIADEIASAAELVMGKDKGVPVAIVRGIDPEWAEALLWLPRSSGRRLRICSADAAGIAAADPSICDPHANSQLPSKSA